MQVGVGIWYAARLVMLVVAIALGSGGAMFAARRRKLAGLYRAISAPVFACIAAALAVLSAARPSWLWVAAALVAGIGIGVPFGRMAKPAMRGGEPSVRRWVVGPVVWGLGVAVFSITVLFGTPMLAALASIWVVFGVATIAGGEIGEYAVARKAASVMYSPEPPAYPVAQPYPQQAYPQQPAYVPVQQPQPAYPPAPPPAEAPAPPPAEPPAEPSGQPPQP